MGGETGRSGRIVGNAWAWVFKRLCEELAEDWPRERKIAGGESSNQTDNGRTVRRALPRSELTGQSTLELALWGQLDDSLVRYLS